MAKANANKVNPALANLAVQTGKDRGALYSECVRLSYQHTGRLSCGFDSKDLQAWIDENCSDLFNEKGKRKNE